MSSTEVRTIQLQLSDARATEELGYKLGSLVTERLVVALVGPLGAGKTTFAKGVAEGLDVHELVNSPTFTMLNEFSSGRIPFYHLDLYRTHENGGSSESASHAGLQWLTTELDELSSGPGVILIEWADFMDEWIGQRDHILIQLNYSKSQLSTNVDNEDLLGDGRSATLSAFGEISNKLLDDLSII